MSGLDQFIAPTKAGDLRRIGDVKGAATGWLIDQIRNRHQGPILMLCNDSESASRIRREIRFFAGDSLPVMLFPDWETLAYDSFSPHQDITSTRLETLYRLQGLKSGVIVVPASTAMQRVAPKEFVSGNVFWLEKGQQLDADMMREQLIDAGYNLVDTVYEHGEFAVRGAIIDLYPTGTSAPLRIDLFDDEIDTLRTFDPETQRSIEQIERIRILPAREYPFHSKAIDGFKQRWRQRFDVDYGNCPIYQDISSGLAPAGIEYYLPLFFEQCSTLFDYLPESTLVIQQKGILEAASQFHNSVVSRHSERQGDITRPILTPDELFLTPDALASDLKRWPGIRLNPESEEVKPGRENIGATEPPSLSTSPTAAEPLRPLANHLDSASTPVLILAESAGRRESLLTQLQAMSIKPVQLDSWQAFQDSNEALAISVAPLEYGLAITDQFEVISEAQLFGNQVFQRRRRQREQSDADQAVKSLSELSIGNPVVHIDHGVGRYLGLQTIDLDGSATEFLTLQYANDAKLYVPVSSLHLISRYTGASEDSAPLHRLGTEQWSKARRKAAEKVRDAAAELLDIYARRAARQGYQYSIDDAMYDQFSRAFPFEETPDQAMAIEAVRRDMQAVQPMDRLVCGDVGFGKTEVAMRAAFIAAQAGKQVAVLVPTTLLAQQHFENFRDRFADWPMEVDLISRFKTGKQQDQIAAKVEAGQVDILIGTHKLIQGDLKFSNLGLLIIDEEHRFGVQQKEKLKSLRSEVDILTLTATPIPRTLNMAMSGMRDLSIIATAPAKRLSVKTFVRQSDPALIKEAILRELLRGGQVYYLHNEVKTIEQTAKELGELIPEARIGIGHGQMRERELEQVMSDFYHKRFNVLVSTTIIETGIDVPNANTIIIDRADKFGLAQLHQLRGRVGRSHHQAYAYLLTPHHKAMTSDATKRLDAIVEASTLGAGFTLATHDLEIRGAGELLGEEQSGQMQTIGFSLYMEMLEQAVESIKEGKTPNFDQPLHHGCEVNLHLPALIPDDYLPDVHNRLTLYKRIANASNDEELRELQVEMIDRFGLLPKPLQNLIRQTSIKLRAEKLDIIKLDTGAGSGRLEFAEETCVDPYTLVKLVQTQPKVYKLDGATAFKFSVPMENSETRFQTVEALLDTLTPAKD